MHKIHIIRDDEDALISSIFPKTRGHMELRYNYREVSRDRLICIHLKGISSIPDSNLTSKINDLNGTVT